MPPQDHCPGTALVNKGNSRRAREPPMPAVAGLQTAQFLVQYIRNVEGTVNSFSQFFSRKFKTHNTVFRASAVAWLLRKACGARAVLAMAEVSGGLGGASRSRGGIQPGVQGTSENPGWVLSGTSPANWRGFPRAALHVRSPPRTCVPKREASKKRGFPDVPYCKSTQPFCGCIAKRVMRASFKGKYRR
jgi:hypothetical protein